MQHKQRALAYLLSSYQHNSEGAPVMQIESIENTNADRRWQWPHLYCAALYRLMSGSRAGAAVHANAPPRWLPHLPPSRVPTRGGDFHDINAALRGTHLHNAILQIFQHALFWNLWQVLQVINWYVKLGPVVGNHALTVVSRWERNGHNRYGHRAKTLTCF